MNAFQIIVVSVALVAVGWDVATRRIPNALTFGAAVAGANPAFALVLIIGGVLGFLPILGFWMLPLGVVVLAREVPAVARLVERVKRRWRRP